MQNERQIIGKSEDIEAEYGVRSDAAFTLILISEGEIYAVEGFATLKAAQQA